MHGREFSEPVILFANPPPLEELCAVTVFVQKQSQVGLTFQPQVIKCRELIFTEPDIIATPSVDFDNSLHIIMQSLYKTGRLQNRFQKIRLDASKPYRVTPALYQSCLRYTLTAKLAPHWNKAEQWMLQGRDFLTNTGYANAVNINLVVNKDELFLSVLASAVRFPPLQLDHLCLDEHEMNSILQSPEGKLHRVPLTDCWCHVLPSMKRARVFSVSHGVPDGSPFTSYRDFKRHWKNMYGYRLPESDDDFFYYEVSFWASGGGKMFTYPGVCLRAMNIQKIPRVDCKPILVEFLQDVHSKMPSVCGHHLRFQPKLRYMMPGLYAGSEEKDQCAINLSNKNPASKGVPLRNTGDLQRIYPSHTGDKIVTIHVTTVNNKCVSVADGSVPSQSAIGIGHFMTHDVCKAKPHLQSNMTPLCPNISSTSQPSITTSQSESAVKRVIPVFRPKTRPVSLLSASSDALVKRIVPSFKAPPKFSTKHNVELKNSDYICTMNNTESEVNNVSQSDPFASKPVFRPNKKTVTNSSSVKLPSHSNGFVNNLSLSSPLPHSGVFQSHSQLSLGGNNTINDITTKPITGFTPNSKTNNPTSAGKKREHANTDAQDTDVKKARHRQQVQDVNVEQLAQLDQLGKVNATTLAAWLRQRGVPCKSKDKKGELVERVKHIVCLSHAET